MRHRIGYPDLYAMLLSTSIRKTLLRAKYGFIIV